MEPFDRLKSALADRYTVERKIGEGGMADVYLTHDVRHNRKVAIKVMHRDLAELVGVERFLREIMSCLPRTERQTSLLEIEAVICLDF
jgi:serine/threonine protein kinase